MKNICNVAQKIDSCEKMVRGGRGFLGRKDSGHNNKRNNMHFGDSRT